MGSVIFTVCLEQGALREGFEKRKLRDYLAQDILTDWHRGCLD
jgi:hypothetical protein